MSLSVIRLDSAEFAPIAALLEAWSEAPEPESLSAIARRLGVSERLLTRRFASWAGVSAADFLSADSLALNGTGVLANKIVQVEEHEARRATRSFNATPLHRHLIRTPFGTAELALDAEDRLWGLKYLDGCAAIVGTGRSARRGDKRAHKWADEWAERLFALESGAPLRLVLEGTPFQREVWRALLARDTQECIDYGTLAKAIGRRNSQRAVGTAVGANPIGWIIPCHHVLRADGSLGGFRWGIARKRAMLVWESIAPTPSRAIPG